jgi:hypothetical protein
LLWFRFNVDVAIPMSFLLRALLPAKAYIFLRGDCQSDGYPLLGILGTLTR